MTKNDIRLLELAKGNPKKYQIVIDNDHIWVDNISNEEAMFVGSFENYGYEFAYNLLNHLGYNVDYC